MRHSTGRQFALLLLLTGAALGLSACGGDEPYVDAGSAIVISLPTPEPTINPLLANLTESQVLLLRVDYLSSLSALLVEMRDINRDLMRLSDYESLLDEIDYDSIGGGPDLDWVVSVDGASRRAGGYYDFQYQVELPEALNEYGTLYENYLLAVETSAIGVTALLDASVFLGPSGRTYLDLVPEDRARMRGYMVRAHFYLKNAGVLIDHATQIAARELRKYDISDR